MPFGGLYKDQKVLITGHTGFKGSWLTAWLGHLGADVAGLSKDVPTSPSMFEQLGLEQRVRHHKADVRDLAAVREIVATERPAFIFHMAAQAIVSRSYADPVETFMTNTAGTMHVLEALRSVDWPCTAVLITSDKCYDNVEWTWGYRETDALGGRDIYSGSKGAAELVIRSYVHSFFAAGNPVRVAVGRAGNVIGGGDWAPDRIVVDCMRAWREKRPVEIRSPRATRPWQHVLEPLSGYLTLAKALSEDTRLHGEAFNIGPRPELSSTVVELLGALAERWGFADPADAYRVAGNGSFHEASLLKLNCDKALFHLKWQPNLEYAETINLVADWYLGHDKGEVDLYQLTMSQIVEYERLAAARGRVWA